MSDASVRAPGLAAPLAPAPAAATAPVPELDAGSFAPRCQIAIKKSRKKGRNVLCGSEVQELFGCYNPACNTLVHPNCSTKLLNYGDVRLQDRPGDPKTVFCTIICYRRWISEQTQPDECSEEDDDEVVVLAEEEVGAPAILEAMQSPVPQLPPMDMDPIVACAPATPPPPPPAAAPIAAAVAATTTATYTPASSVTTSTTSATQNKKKKLRLTGQTKGEGETPGDSTNDLVSRMVGGDNVASLGNKQPNLSTTNHSHNKKEASTGAPCDYVYEGPVKKALAKISLEDLAGWTQKTVRSMSGSSGKGRVNHYWYTPHKKCLLRSRLEIQRYLAAYNDPNDPDGCYKDKAKAATKAKKQGKKRKQSSAWETASTTPSKTMTNKKGKTTTIITTTTYNLKQKEAKTPEKSTPQKPLREEEEEDLPSPPPPPTPQAQQPSHEGGEENTENPALELAAEATALEDEISSLFISPPMLEEEEEQKEEEEEAKQEQRDKEEDIVDKPEEEKKETPLPTRVEEEEVKEDLHADQEQEQRNGCVIS